MSQNSQSFLFTGNTTLLAIIFLAVIVFFVIVGFGLAENTLKVTSRRINEQAAIRIAEAGIEKAVWCLNNPRNRADCPGNPDYQESDVEVGNGRFSVSVSGSGSSRTIESTGRVSGAGGMSTKTLRIRLSSTANDIAFFYGVQIGEGGLAMDRNSKIVGNAMVNGDVRGVAHPTIEGDVIVAGDVEESTAAQSTTCNQGQIVGQHNPEVDFAQSFQAPVSKLLVKVSLYLKKVGSPGSRTIRVAADNNGVPAATELARASLNASLVEAQYGWIDVIFQNPPAVNAGQTYWIIFDSDEHRNEYWVWCKDSAGGYASGGARYSQDWDKKPWTDVTGDLNFRTYFGFGINTLDSVTVTGTARANTITNSKICEDAYYQTIDQSSQNFLNAPSSPTCPVPLTNGTGFPNSPDFSPAPLPVSSANIEQWKADAREGGTISGDVNVTNNMSLGPKEITGSLLMTTNNRVLTITGTLYIRGNIDLNNGSIIRCDEGYAENSCIIVTDGWIHVDNNGSFAGSGSSGSFVIVVSTHNCTGVPGTNCTHHDSVADLHNRTVGSIFYAPNGMVNLHNGADVTEVVAYKLRLDNNATVTYEQGLVDTTFTAGPGGSWKYQRGSYQIVN